MIKKVIYLSQEKLSEKIRRDWYINDLIDFKYNVEFWDVSYLIKHNRTSNERHAEISIKEFKEYNHLYNEVKNSDNKNCIYVILIPYTYEAISIYRLITKFNLFTVFFYWGEFPLVYTKKNLLSKLKNYFSLNINLVLLVKRIIQRQYIKILRKFGLIKKYDLCFTAGQMCKDSAYAHRKIGINLCDYKQNMLTDDIKLENKYSVFVDINLPYHTDTYYSYSINDINYFNSLNNFFEKYENEYGTKVVIAAHPKSKYKEETFCGRKIYYLKTAELIKSCEHVFIHHSTAISYAILNYKPITFLVTDDMRNSTDYMLTKGLADYLDNQLINIDHITSKNIKISSLNKQLYDKYKYDYIVSRETEGIDTTRIVINSLNKIPNV